MASAGTAKALVPSPASCPPAKKRAGAVALAGEVAAENPNIVLPHKPPLANGYHSSLPDSTPAVAPPSAGGASGDIDDPLCRAEFLSRVEVLRRRSRCAKAFVAELRDHYWATMEALRVKVRDYYWKFGVSPMEEGDARAAAMENGGVCNGGVVGERSIGLGIVKEENGEFGKKRKRSVEVSGCIYPSCKAKAMALSSHCHQHILSDPKQTLYKPCSSIQKSGPNRTTICGKPVLQAAVPPLCSVHLQKSEKRLCQALKKYGLSTSSPSMHSPKLHVLVSEHVRQIQAKRKETQKNVTSSSVDKDNTVE